MPVGARGHSFTYQAKRSGMSSKSMLVPLGPRQAERGLRSSRACQVDGILKTARYAVLVLPRWSGSAGDDGVQQT